MRREGNKILFDSVDQQQRFANALEAGSKEFMTLIMAMIARAARNKSEAWRYMEERLEGQLGPDEVLQYNFAKDELVVVKTDTESYPERAPLKGDPK